MRDGCFDLGCEVEPTGQRVTVRVDDLLVFHEHPAFSKCLQRRDYGRHLARRALAPDLPEQRMLFAGVLA